jgi:hypothetical protein
MRSHGCSTAPAHPVPRVGRELDDTPPGAVISVGRSADAVGHAMPILRDRWSIRVQQLVGQLQRAEFTAVDVPKHIGDIHDDHLTE